MRATGEGVKIQGEGQQHLGEGHGRDGEERTAQAEHRPRNGDRKQRRHTGGGHQRCPRRDMQLEIEIGRRVGTGGEEHAVPERELAAQPADDIPGGGKAGKQEGAGQDVESKTVACENENQRRQRRQHGEVDWQLARKCPHAC